MAMGVHLVARAAQIGFSRASKESLRRSATRATVVRTFKRFSHDIGGDKELYGPMEGAKTPSDLLHWEQQCHSLFAVLASKQVVTTDQLRYTVEGLTAHQYADWSYYERWTASMTTLLLAKRLITHQELADLLYGSTTSQPQSADNAQFEPGDQVRVLDHQSGGTEWQRPHIRTPGYIYGATGRIVDVCGQFADPSLAALGFDNPPSLWLYRVSFLMKNLWPEQQMSTSEDVVSVEVYQNWLEPSDGESGHAYEDVALFNHDDDGRDCDHGHSHGHDHHHHHHSHDHDDHSHDPRSSVEKRAAELEGHARPGQKLHRALCKLLLDKQIISADDLRLMMERMDTAGRDLTGAKLVVEAWIDPEFEKRLLDDASSAASEVGVQTANPNAPTVLTVVQNTPQMHNLVVCTLCSCYPSGLLGIAPSWYKSGAYRARAVREPRSVLQSDFGVTLPSEQQVQVHDSTADHRYLVLPMRPSGTEGWSKEKLQSLVSRDSMIGVSVPKVE